MRWPIAFSAIALMMAGGAMAGTDGVAGATGTATAAAPAGAAAPAIAYPATMRGDVVDVQFGTPVADPYRWLEGD
ncbi:MAG: hypothetical protein ACKOUM_08480, partial [Sphingopyxis sp.]